MKLVSIAPNQTLVTIEDSDFYFSYDTCVAVRNKEGGFRIKSPSMTTTRHMRNMGVSDFFLISEEELEQYFPKTLPRLTKKVIFAFISRHEPTHEQTLLAAKQNIILYHIGDANAFTITPAWVKSKTPTITESLKGVVVAHPAAAMRLCKDYLIGVFENALHRHADEPPQFETKSFHVYDIK